VVKPLRRPQYRLYAIASGRVEPSQEDLERLARNFQLVQGAFTREEIDALHRLNPGFKVLLYLNSTYTQSSEDIRVAESQYRGGLAMFLTARLAEDVEPGVRQFRLEALGKRPVPLRASTVEGDLSSTEPGRPSTKHYVTWIRVGDELMRVDRFHPETGRIAVTRGFHGTEAGRHSKGANVFSPVYLGSVNDTGAYPGGPGRTLRYVLSADNEAGHRWRAEIVLGYMKEGYDGGWLDILSSDPFNMSDCLEQRVRPWDFRGGQPFERDDWRRYQEEKVAFIQRYIKSRLGRYPVLVGNNMKARCYHEGRGGERLFLMSTEVKPRPMDGMCIENFAVGFRPRPPHGLSFHTGDRWRENVAMLMDAARNGLAAMPMIANAGIKSTLLEPDTAVRDQVERFGYATYLMGVERGGRTMFGIPAFYRVGEGRDQRRFVKLHRQYFWPIGDPAETVPPEKLDKYRVGKSTYMRRFTNGVVLVNSSEEGEEDVRLDGEYVDPETGERFRSVTMQAKTGKILLKTDQHTSRE